MSTRSYQCHSCQKSNNYFQKYCASCELPASVACLKSTGSGVLPSDLIIGLLPTSQSVGSSIHSDILLPTLSVKKQVCTLHFSGGLFHYISSHNENDIKFNNQDIIANQKYSLEHGCIIRFGEEEFELIYFNKHNRSPRFEKEFLSEYAHQSVSTSISRQLQTISFKHALLECHRASDVFSLSLDTLLLMTGLERAYGFMITTHENGEIELQEILAKNSDFKTIVESDQQISQSIIKNSLHKHNSIYISNSDIIKEKSQSMFDFDIKTIICLPLNTTYSNSQKETIGILYVDKQYTSHRLPKKLESSLRTISTMAASTIHKLNNNKNPIPSSETQATIRHLKRELADLRKHLKISSELIDKYHYGNPCAIKTRLRECRKDLLSLSKIISGSAHIPKVHKLEK